MEIELERKEYNWGKVSIKVKLEDMKVISEVDDTEMPADMTIDELKKALNQGIIKPSAKTISERIAILKKRGYKDEHVQKIINELQRQGMI